MARNDGPLSATYWNPILDDFRKWYVETRNMLLQEFYASGYPPGTEPSPPHDIYQRLIALQQTGSPDYWQSQAAQDELRKLEQVYGPAPAVRAQPSPVPAQFPPPGGMQ